MDDLLADFVAETREMLEAIEGELVAWESDPSDRARLDSIFRFVHTVKGNCGFFDFPQLEKLSHAAESTLAEVRAGRRAADSKLVTAILAIIDRITQLSNAIEAGDALNDDGDEFLIAALDADSDDEIAEAAINAREMSSEPSEKPAESPAASPRSIRLPVELLDRVMSGVSDMVLARNDLARRLRDAGNEPTLDGPFERLSGILTDVREAITRMRMQRIESLYNALPRLVRDLSNELGKQVMVDFEGGNVELDREMIEMIRDPITHLIRNAVDHGIEKPADRLAKGKREIGLLSIASRQSGNTITMVITDDGNGLDEEKIGAKAVQSGIVTQSELDAMPSTAVLDLIFEPGLSTADTVSAVSGRGVGMDVVRANIEKVGGTISVASSPGEGTQFFLNLPLTLSIISALTVSINDQFFAIPHSYVEEIAHGKAASVEFSAVGDSDLVTFRGNRIPCLTLNTVLGVDARRAGSDQRLVLLRMGGGKLFALAVDRIHDQEDLVIKPLSPAIMATRTYAGTTLLDDGRPVLMLDIPAIAERYGLVSDIRGRTRQVAPVEELVSDKASRALMTFTDLDGRKRAINLDLVARIDQVPVEAFDIEGSRANVVIDGSIFDCIGKLDYPLPAGQVKILRLSDSENELAYPVAELGQSEDYAGELTPVDGDPEVEGLALIAGEPVPVLGGFYLFAGKHPVHNSATAPLCRLPENDPWTERMLAPLIEAAGYAIAKDDAESADITIALAGETRTSPETGDVPIITLYNDPAAVAGQSGAIYRYDRSAIMEALHNAKRRKAS